MTLAADQVSVRRGRVLAVDGVSVELEAGQVLGIVGPNGAGKSTLLAVLAGLQRPADGCSYLDGVDVLSLDHADRARHISYLAQQHEVHWPLSVTEIVGLGRYPHGNAASLQSVEAVHQAIRITQIEHLAERNVLKLSAGERARVLLARMLAVEADYLLCDEPTAALDPYNQLQALGILRNQAELGKGVCVIMHDLTLAVRFCDRIALMSEGRMHGIGVPDEVLSADNIRTVYRVEALFGEAEGQRYVLPWRTE